MNLTKQIWLSMGFMCVAILALGTFGYIESSYLFTKLDKVSSTNLPVVEAMANTDMRHDTIKSSVYSALYNYSKGDFSAVAEILKENKDSEKDIRHNLEVISKSGLSAKTKEALSSSNAELEAYIEGSNLLIQRLTQKNQQNLDSDVQKFEVAFKALESKLEALGEQIAKETTTEAENAGVVLNTMLFSAIASFIFGLSVSFYTIRRLTLNLKKYTSELDESSNLVKSISESLSAANVQLSSSATESASSLEETVASLEELSSMINLNTENSKKSFQVSELAQSAAETGDRNIRELSSAMLVIRSDSKKMEDIVNVIDDISFQTNLLALNAAVEAARAGEQGKGFAVVADAVRSLAQRSSSSAKEITTMIKDSIDKIEKGSLLANECNQSLKNIFEHIKNVTQLSGQIAQASTEQTAGLKQINQAMIQLDSASQENASTAEQVSKSAEEANIQSDNMNHVVGELTAFIFGQVNDTAPVNSKTGAGYSAPKSNLVRLNKATAQRGSRGASKKSNLDLGPEPSNNEIKKVENF